jgi:hypothetical protein
MIENEINLTFEKFNHIVPHHVVNQLKEGQNNNNNIALDTFFIFFTFFYIKKKG